ncbi:unnamed protein product, partial [marine sediment metagenome]
MGANSPYEKAQKLLELAKEESDSEIRKLRLLAAKRYFNADIRGITSRRQSRGVLIFLLFYVVIISTV